MKTKFTGYQTFIVVILAFLQFTIMLDFMIMSPLGAILLNDLGITTRQFGLVVSAYAFSAGISGLLTAGFADKFDRKRLLLFFYTGFVAGTFLCGMAPGYRFLLFARVITGLFGGVISSISLSIVTDLFPMNIRGRAMGIIMTAFSVSQVMGIPAGIWLANLWGWHAPFVMIASVSSFTGIFIALKLKPIRDHLARGRERKALKHLQLTIFNPSYLYAFFVTALLTTGGFMLMPFASAFSVNNLGISMEELPIVYLVTGMATMVTGPLAGKLSDSQGKYKVFSAGSIMAILIVAYYSGLGKTPLWMVIMISVFMFVAISARMVSATTLTSAVPEPSDRGAFMSINTSMRQLFGGFGSMFAGLIVVQTATGKIEHYQALGLITGFIMLLTVTLMYRIYIKYEKAETDPERKEG